MMHEEIERWRERREDYLSTGSRSNYGSEVGNPVESEVDLLRFQPDTRNRGITLTKSQKVKGAITLAVIVTVASVFGAIYSTAGNEPKRDFLHDAHELTPRSSVIVVEEHELTTTAPRKIKNTPLTTIVRTDSALKHATAPSPDRTKTNGTGTDVVDITKAPHQEEIQSDFVPIPKKHFFKHTGPLILPVNATLKPAMNLIQEAKLVQPPTDKYFNYTECIDIDANNKKRSMGWKAYLFIDTERANIDSSRNPFVGYGVSKGAARKQAAESAIQAVYPGQISYPPPDNLSEIPKYCDD